MIFIIGGREQGKTAYAAELWKQRCISIPVCEEPRIADGRMEMDETAAMQAELITHFELWVRREMEAGRDPYAFAERLMQENPEAFVTADEIGCGIVPMEAFERDYRETDGRVCQRIAAFSEEVHRVICGLGMRIK